MLLNQENLSGKDLTEQLGDKWVPARAQRGHEGDEQSGVNWVATRAQSGHEGKEQSVAGQSTGHTVFRWESAAECQKGFQWLKGMQSSKESVETPEERHTAMKAASNQDGKRTARECKEDTE